MFTVKDRENEKYGKLVLGKRLGRNKHRQSIYLCYCDCGAEITSCITHLVHGDRLDCGCEKNDKLYKNIQSRSVSPIFEQIFDGLMLGDGSIHLPFGGKNARFSQHCQHRSVLINYISLFNNEQIFFPESNPYERVTESKDGKRLITTYILQSTIDYFLTRQYYRWYKNGLKIVPKDLILTPLVIKYWYYGDGGLKYNHHLTREINFATEGFSLKDVDFLGMLLCDVLGIKKVRFGLKKDSTQSIIIINKSDISTLLDYIGPCDIPCYQYKWIIDNRELYNNYMHNCPCTVSE